MRVEIYYRDAEEETPNVFDAKEVKIARLYDQKYVIIRMEDSTALINYDAIACIIIYGDVVKLGDIEL